MPFLAACGPEAPAVHPLLGSTVPDLTLPLLGGGVHHFSKANGPCLINFWATWCPPCRAEMASLGQLAKDMLPRGLPLFAVSADEDDNLVKEFVDHESIGFPVLLDPAGQAIYAYFGVDAYPTTLLVDRQGRVAEVWVGARDWGAAEVRAAIDRHLIS